MLEEAKEVFEPTVAPRDFDLIEIPFPERGDPELVQNGRANGIEDDRDSSLAAATLAPSFNPVL